MSLAKSQVGIAQKLPLGSWNILDNLLVILPEAEAAAWSNISFNILRFRPSSPPFPLEIS